MDFLSNSHYKMSFLSNLDEKTLSNSADIQLYKLEDYLKDILRPVAPYRTSFNFILFVTQGEVEQFLENEIVKVRKNSFLFIKQGAITATMELSDNLKGYFLAYENTILSEQDLPIHKASIFHMTPFQNLDEPSFDTLKKLLEILEQELWLNEFAINDISIALLHTVLLKMLSKDTHKTKKLTTRALDISLGFRDLLFKHHLEEKHVSFYAAKLSITENYLNKCIKSVSQKTPKQWINQVDVNYGKALLHSSKSIAEIAFELNFQTASHFTQLFKKITGLTPKAYRSEFVNHNE